MNTKNLDLTAVLAHEVKNPVALIKANIELIELDNNISIYQKNLSVIKKELSKINNIVTDFADIFKNSGEKDFEDIFLYDMITDITEELQVSVENISFSVNCKDEDIRINSDYKKLSIVLSNIYKNSIEAMDNIYIGDIKTNIFRNLENTFIEVIDNGVGICENILPYVGNNFVTNKKSGSGLGILICKEMVEKLGGSFEIFNNNIRGCKVILKF